MMKSYSEAEKDEEAFLSEIFIYTPFFSHQMELKGTRKGSHLLELSGFEQTVPCLGHVFIKVWSFSVLRKVIFFTLRTFLQVQVVTRQDHK